MSSSTPDTTVLTLQLPETVVRAYVPQSTTPTRVFVLIHGWTGDETFMSPFAAMLPAGALAVAFRAPYRARSPRGGYSWTEGHSSHLPQYQAAASLLTNWLKALAPRFPHAPWDRQHWVGFSQGAAVSGVFALTYPHHVASLTMLSGFLPPETPSMLHHRPLEGKRVFIAHGLHDNIVPIAMAQQAREILTLAGAAVTYCEDQVAHKVGAHCAKALVTFFATL